MSQPYSLGLDESRGRPLLSVCAGAAHALASTALLVRQQSLDEPSDRGTGDAHLGDVLQKRERAKALIRQGSMEGFDKKKKTDEGDHRKKIKNNMISHLGGLLAVEGNDANALRVVLSKNAFDVNAKLSNCLYAEYKTKWTLLDVALLLGHRECAELLITNGAQENILTHLGTYQPEFLALYCRLSIFVEYFMMISQHEQRKSMLENDAKVYQKQYEVLAGFQKSLEDVWKNARWISRIASTARDKNSTHMAVPLCRLMAPLHAGSSEDVADVGYHSDQSTDKTDCGLLAVEGNDANALRVVLSKNAFDVNAKLSNCLYAEYKTKWTLLDVALLLGHRECAELLITNGAQENILMNSFAKRSEAVKEAVDSTKGRMSALRAGPPSKDTDKQLKLLTVHCELLHKMGHHVGAEVLPGPAEDVEAQVTGPYEVTVYFHAPSNFETAIVKYKVEWCASPAFDGHIDSWEETNMTKLPVKIGNLEKAGNIFGYGPPVSANPAVVMLSSWEDVEGPKDGRHEHMASISAISDQIDKHRNSLVWQRVFPSNDANGKKRRTGLKELFTASSKFSKNLQRGCYLATIIYTEGKLACTVDDCLPIIEVDESITTVNRDDFHWLMKLSVCWDQLPVLLDYNQNAYSNTNSLNFRAKLIAAAQSMHSALGLKDIGRLYQQPIVHENCIFLVTVRFVTDMSYVQALTLRWMSFDKLLRKKTPCTALDALNKNIVTVMNFFEACQISLKRGLYLGYLKLQSAINCARVVVPDSLPTVLPFVKVRDNPHVTEEEWNWIKAIDQNEAIDPSEFQKTMHSQLCNASNALLQDLDVDPDLVPGHRLYRAEVLQPHADVSIILLLPKPEEVCAAPTGSPGHGEFVESRRGCYSLPIPVFEIAHLGTYQPEFLALYCRLSIFVEYFMMISQHEQRKSMLENDAKVYQKQYEVLAGFSRIASTARDKNSTHMAVPLCRLMAPLHAGSSEDVADVGYHSDQSTDKTDCDRPVARVRPQSHAGSPRIGAKILDIEPLQLSRNRPSTIQPVTSSTVCKVPGSPGSHSLDSRKHIPSSCHIKIFAAYDCGLPEGTSVRLSISPNTTSMEVVSYVVEQLAKAAAKVKRLDDVDLPDANDFCLASVVGAKEKRLKEDHPVLRLQPPWSKGKLFVRRKDTILAAIYYGNESYV
ncbi:unnamed protein product, partial [Mesorhabditis spiculigera]